MLVDRARDNFTVFETSAILLYLQQHYDTEGKLGFDPKEQPNQYSEMLQWMFFQVAFALLVFVDSGISNCKLPAWGCRANARTRLVIHTMKACL